MEKTGQKIRRIRKSKRLTLQQLSAEIGVSISAVSQYERGIIKPDALTLIKIARFFECPISDIVASSDIANISEDLSIFMTATPHGNPSEREIDLEKELALIESGAIPCTFLHEAFATVTDGKTLEVMYNDSKSHPIYIEYDRLYAACKVLEQLNGEGRQKAIEYLGDLLEIPRYKREVTPCTEDVPPTAAD